MSRRVVLIVRERDYAPTAAHGEPPITVFHAIEVDCPELAALYDKRHNPDGSVRYTSVEVVGAEAKEAADAKD